MLERSSKGTPVSLTTSNSTHALAPSHKTVSKLIRTIEQRLRLRYNSPRLGNPRLPLDDLVFILISGRTHAANHLHAFKRLKTRYPTWEAALKAGPARIQEAIVSAGLSRKKARHIHRTLSTLKIRFGHPTLTPLSHLDNVTLEAELTALPGVGLKSARCVMLYTMKRKVFPVDSHTIRVFGRLGLANPLVRTEYAQDPLQAIVPPALRYSLHVNVIAHGRSVCLPKNPQCRSCTLRSLCPCGKVIAKAGSAPPSTAGGSTTFS